MRGGGGNRADPTTPSRTRDERLWDGEDYRAAGPWEAVGSEVGTLRSRNSFCATSSSVQVRQDIKGGGKVISGKV